jgi:cysteine desulfurase / selenocysteine lyase
MTALPVATTPRNYDFDVQAVRRDFPILSRTMNGKPLVFLDSAASAQKPRAVIDAFVTLYETEYANIHRGIYAFSVNTTDRHDAARETVRRFLNAGDAREIVFTRNATEAINLVAASWGAHNLRPGDEIIVSAMEHHANIVPWQLIAQRTGAAVRVAPILADGSFDFDGYAALLGTRTKLVAITHMSNVLGTITPAREIVAAAHAAGALALLDGSQAVVHGGVDVQALDADFYVFTGHKLYGPNGIGVLYGKYAVLDAMPPYQGGGDMIDHVSWQGTTYAAPPMRFEAGTPPIAETLALAAAIDYVTGLGQDRVAAHEAELLAAATQRLSSIAGLRLIGTAAGKGPVVSFTLDGVHALDLGALLDQQGIAVRVGQHCAEPLMDLLCIPGTVRASFALYNTLDEVEALARGVETAARRLRS